jgi:hypothetical protein
MRPATVRRLLVFGFCAFGVGALYLAPGTARSPERVVASGQPEPDAAPQMVSASYSPDVPAPKPATRGPGVRRPKPPRTEPRAPQDPQLVATEDLPTWQPTPRRTRAGATARQPQRETDRTAPTAVTAVQVSQVDYKQLTVHWAAAHDDTGVAAYRVWLNGFEVATTVELTATLPWFNDDSASQVVQVRALDAAGNQSESAPTVLVERPEAEVTPAPTPTPTPSPEGQSTTPPPGATQTDAGPVEPTPTASAHG